MTPNTCICAKCDTCPSYQMCPLWHRHTHAHTHTLLHTSTHTRTWAGSCTRYSSSYLAKMSLVVGRRLTSLCKMKLSRSTTTGMCSTGRSLSGDKSTCIYRNRGHVSGHSHTAHGVMSIKGKTQEPLCVALTTAMPSCRPCWGSLLGT